MRARAGHRAIVPLLVVAGALIAPAVVAADTIIVGGNVVNQTWTAAASPYIVQGDITVPVGSTLRIEPGAVVRFTERDDQGSGIDPGRVELTVNGTLRVEGSRGAPVRLEGVVRARGSWYGIIVSTSSPLAVLHDFELRHAGTGISHAGTTDSIDMARGLIEAVAGPGIYTNGSLDADSIEVRDSGEGLRVDGNASLSNCVLHGLGNGVLSWGTVVLEHCTIAGNGDVGVWSGSSTASTTIRSSIVTGHAGFGVIASLAAARTEVLHSNVWGNTMNYGNASPGAGTISANPLFVSASDLRLQPSSVSIDTAAAGGVDHDVVGAPRPIDGDGIGGAAPDMGAYEHVPVGTPVPDAGVPDAGVPDAAVPDAAVPDAAVPDTATDAGADASDAAASGDGGGGGGGTEPPTGGSCSAGAGSLPGAGLLGLAALLARRRARMRQFGA